MTHILIKKQKIDLKYLGLWGLQILWLFEMAFALFFIFIMAMEILTSTEFEYYGYPQWQWFYQNQLTLIRYNLTEIVIAAVSIGYSVRWKKKNIFTALVIGIIPYVMIKLEMMFFNVMI